MLNVLRFHVEDLRTAIDSAVSPDGMHAYVLVNLLDPALSRILKHDEDTPLYFAWYMLSKALKARGMDLGASLQTMGLL